MTSEISTIDDRASWIPLFQMDEKSTCPLGMPMCQNRLAVPTWSYAMELYPPSRIVEIGTGNGAFTTAIAVHAKMLNIPVITYDRQIPDERIAPLARSLGVEFRRVDDLWKVADQIAHSIHPRIKGHPYRPRGPVYVLCDGGDKASEFAYFAAHLMPGDVIAAHDFDACHELDPLMPAERRWWPWGEIQTRDTEPVAAKHGLERWLPSYFDRAGWIAYRKR